MFEPRLTRDLFESGGEDAYIREAIARSAREEREQIREDLRLIMARATHFWPDPAIRKTFKRGYDRPILETIAMCYLIASNEEWEDLDVDQLTKVFEEAIGIAETERPDDYLRDAENRAWFLTMGLARGYRDLAPAKEVLEQHTSVERMSSAFRVMGGSARAIHKLKRRHRSDYADATFAAFNIGSALGVLDRIGQIPGSAPTESRA
jgi:hypothetical protein